MNASAHLVRGFGLQLSVRHVADVVVVDVCGKATIGCANDLLDNQLRQLIDEGNDKYSAQSNRRDADGFLEDQQRHSGIQIPRASWCEFETAWDLVEM